MILVIFVSFFSLSLVSFIVISFFSLTRTEQHTLCNELMICDVFLGKVYVYLALCAYVCGPGVGACERVWEGDVDKSRRRGIDGVGDSD